MKTSQTRSRSLPSNDELLSQIRLLLDSPEDDLQAAIMKELLAGTLRLHDFSGRATRVKLLAFASGVLRFNDECAFGGQIKR